MSNYELSAAAKQHIEEWRAKFPPEQSKSSIMPGLTFLQDENGGHLTPQLMDALADYLAVPKIAVYEVATFYSMYEHKPQGRHKLCICTNISCTLRGVDDIVDHVKQKLGIGFGEVTEDGRFSLKEVECLAACGKAPSMMVGEHYYENLTVARIDEILEELK